MTTNLPQKVPGAGVEPNTIETPVNTTKQNTYKTLRGVNRGVNKLLFIIKNKTFYNIFNPKSEIMKKLFTFLVLLLFTLKGYSQCNGVWFTSQAQINSFPANCTIIDGPVKIIGSGITNLSGLNNVTKINGWLEIRKTNLGNLTGLNHLESVQGISINRNNNLHNVWALQNLTECEEGILISDNDALIDLKGFGGITETQRVHVRYNENLENLNGLENITHFVDGASIDSRWLHITYNKNLQDIWDIEGIDHNSFSHVQIYKNDFLSICNQDNICAWVADTLNHPNTKILLNRSNVSGCNSIDEIIGTCTDWDCCGLFNFGDPCDDNNPGTINDRITDDCDCEGDENIQSDEDQQGNYQNIEETTPIAVFPNPAIDFIYLEREFDNIQIIDQTGKIMIKLNVAQTVNVSGLLPGMYFIESDNKHGKFTKQ